MVFLLDFRYGKNVTDEFVKNKLNWDRKYWVRTLKKLAKHSKVKQKKCYICSGYKSKKVCNFYGINYLMCSNCSHVYGNKRLSENELTTYYSTDEDYFKKAYTNKKLLALRKNLFIPKIKHVKKYATGKNWLDVGSGDGIAVSAAISEGFNGKGIEISKSARGFARKYLNVELYGQPLETFVLENKKKFDVVSFFGVLEHITKPIEALKISNKLLRKNGIIVMEVPNYDSLSSYVQKLADVTDRHLDPTQHIMMFTLESAKYSLQKTGFRPIVVWCYGMDVI